MAKKTKSQKDIKIVPALGMFLMSLASVVGFFEFTGSDNNLKNLASAKTAVLPMQTVLRAEPVFNAESNQIYREKEESPPEYVSYNGMSTTAPRASKY